jgi:hypothetical protein
MSTRPNNKTPFATETARGFGEGLLDDTDNITLFTGVIHIKGYPLVRSYEHIEKLWAKGTDHHCRTFERGLSFFPTSLYRNIHSLFLVLTIPTVLTKWCPPNDHQNKDGYHHDERCLRIPNCRISLLASKAVWTTNIAGAYKLSYIG